MKVCPGCKTEEEDPRASFCKNCGSDLVEAARISQQPAAPSPAAPPAIQPLAKSGINTTTLILGVTVGILTVVIVIMGLFLTVW